MVDATFTRAERKVYRFDQMTILVNDRVDNPAEAGVDRYVGLEHLDPESLEIRRWGSPNDVNATKLRFRGGDIIFGRRRVYQRKLAVADFDGICSAHAMVLRARSEVVLPGFLPFFMHSDYFMERAKEISVGSLSPTINWTTLAKEQFALPSLEDQRRIAKVLRSSAESREALSGLRQRLVSVETAYLEQALRAVPESVLLPVGDLLLESPRNGISPPVSADGQGFRTASISSVRNGTFDPRGHVKYAECDRVRASQFFVQRGDVFVVRGNGNRTLCGKAGIATESYEDLFYPDLLIRLRFDPGHILPEFAVAQWNLPNVHRTLIARAKSTNGIWKVNGKDIRRHQLLVPPKSFQKVALARINEIRTARQQVRCREGKFAQLQRVLMAQIEPGP